jgi:D-alanyl-D-alanine carboxypeptidase/D-alanyl-D-alanine-endopeptidase (penicillin-binding protein 4)
MRGKTGSISGVKALAGYIDRADGRTLAFAVLGNGAPPAELMRRVAEILAGG